MFIRAIWREERLAGIQHPLRELQTPFSRKGDVLGLCGPDFGKMTLGLFDQ